jgi:hypothetical protein
MTLGVQASGRYEYYALQKSRTSNFADIFAWLYEDLKTFDIDIIQHKIPLKAGSNLFRQKIRKFNPMLMSIIEKEMKRMLDARIIVPLRYLDWVANFVPMRKKSG